MIRCPNDDLNNSFLMEEAENKRKINEMVDIHIFICIK